MKKQPSNRKKNPKILEDVLRNPKQNKFAGMQVDQIMKIPDYKKDVNQIIKKALKETGFNDTVIFKVALKKVQDNMVLEFPETRDLSLTAFAKLVAVDDLLSFVKSIPIVGPLASAAHTLYSENPTVKTFVDRLISKGFNTISDYSNRVSNTFSRLGNSDVPYSLEHANYQSVNLEFLFSCLMPFNPIVSDPDDNPKSVYSGKSTVNFTLTPNSAGNALLMVNSIQFDGGASGNNTSFIYYNNTAAYVPSSSAVSLNWAGIPGPLNSVYTAGTFRSSKRLGIIVEVDPFVALNSSEGGYICGILTQQISSSSSILPNQLILTTTDLLNLPNFRIFDMKTPCQVQLMPTSDPESTFWRDPVSASNISDYGKVFIQLLGVDTTASLNIKITSVWSVIPSQQSLAFIKGSVPPLGSATMKFCEFLKGRYPDIVNWNTKELEELRDKLYAVGSDEYDRLIRIDHVNSFTHKGLKTLNNRNRVIEL